MPDIISSALTHMMNCKKVGKSKCKMPFSSLLVSVLEIMHKNGYIKSYKKEKDKFDYIIVEIGNLNECKAIRPRFYVQKDDYDKYIRRFLPARNLGILIVSTSQGLLTHAQAIEKGIGGSLLAYCY